MDQVKDINRAIVGIAAGAEEQATGLTEINTAVSQLDQVTQQNAAMAEESTAASQTLSDKAIELGGLISVYRLGHHGTGDDDASAPVPFKKREPVARTTISVAPKRQRLVANGPSKDNGGGWEEF